MFKSTIIAALMASVANAQLDTYATCKACLTGGGRQCLTSAGRITFYDLGTCCKSGDESIFCDKPYGQKSFNYCAKSTEIKNEFIQNWTCPQREDMCPQQKDVLIVPTDGTWITQKHTWGPTAPTPAKGGFSVYDKPIPNKEASNWNCKYHVTTPIKKITGFIVVQTEQYGFDEYVTILSQPKVKEIDFTKNFLKDEDDKEVVYQAKFSQKFYIPVTHDALISFKPEQVYAKNPIKENYMGQFRVRAQWVATATDEQLKNVATPAEVLSESGKETKNWDNEVVPGGKWFDRSLFTIGDFEVTVFGLVVGVGGLVAIILVMTCICCIISYRKRHAIADGARRASSAVRRGSEMVRKSFSGKNQEQGTAVAPDTFYSNDKPINDVHKDMLQNMDEAAKPAEDDGKTVA